MSRRWLSGALAGCKPCFTRSGWAGLYWGSRERVGQEQVCSELLFRWCCPILRGPRPFPLWKPSLHRRVSRHPTHLRCSGCRDCMGAACLLRAEGVR